MTGIDENEFTAVLHDLTDPTRPEEEASFALDEIPDGDRDLLMPGSVFYWNIGYETTITGTRKTVSFLRFRRLPAWTKSELAAIKTEAEDLLTLFE